MYATIRMQPRCLRPVVERSASVKLGRLSCEGRRLLTETFIYIADTSGLCGSPSRDVTVASSLASHAVIAVQQ